MGHSNLQKDSHNMGKIWSLYTNNNFKSSVPLVIYLVTLKGHQTFLTFCESIKSFLLGFTMMVYEKIYFEALINTQYICLKIILHNYILYYSNVNYVGIFFCTPKNVSEFTDFKHCTFPQIPSSFSRRSWHSLCSFGVFWVGNSSRSTRNKV